MTPKTEDQLEDDAVVLMKLGSDSQGSKLRARMMCASLYSDMESFKVMPSIISRIPVDIFLFVNIFTQRHLVPN